MPLPDEALTVDGGCNCGAIRYRVAIPPLAGRQLHPLSPVMDPVPLPFIVLDHCNDCRRATGSLLPAWLCAPIDICSVSLVTASLATLPSKAAARQSQPDEQHGPWIPAAVIFTTMPANADHFLASYESSNERWRWFCSRCGTSIAYTAVMPKGFPDMLDITLGSVERSHLDAHSLIPERQLWWDYGIDWIRRLATEGYGGLPIHPDYRLADKVTLHCSN
jgi:hypothetical protein